MPSRVDAPRGLAVITKFFGSCENVAMETVQFEPSSVAKMTKRKGVAVIDLVNNQVEREKDSYFSEEFL